MIIKNPMTIWLQWWVNKKLMEYKHRKEHLKIGYLANVDKNCKLGKYAIIYDIIWPPPPFKK
jgi:hypothetical protein